MKRDVDAVEACGSRTAGRPSARRSRDHVGGEELEVRAARRRRRRRRQPPVGMAAAVLHPPQLDDALVELVVAHGVEIEAHPVHRLDRRLVVEQRGHERAGADEVARRDGERVARALPAQRADRRGEVLSAAGGDGRGAGLLGDRARRVRLEVAVEVVDGQDLAGRALPTLRVCGRGKREQQHRQEAGQGNQGFVHGPQPSHARDGARVGRVTDRPPSRRSRAQANSAVVVRPYAGDRRGLGDPARHLRHLLERDPVEHRDGGVRVDLLPVDDRLRRRRGARRRSCSRRRAPAARRRTPAPARPPPPAARSSRRSSTISRMRV